LVMLMFDHVPRLSVLNLPHNLQTPKLPWGLGGSEGRMTGWSGANCMLSRVQDRRGRISVGVVYCASVPRSAPCTGEWSNLGRRDFRCGPDGWHKWQRWHVFRELPNCGCRASAKYFIQAGVILSLYLLPKLGPAKRSWRVHRTRRLPDLEPGGWRISSTPGHLGYCSASGK
jgi:hypothetical protein